MQRQKTSPDTIRSPVVHSTKSIQQTVSFTTTPQTGGDDAESRNIREGSVATDDSVSSPTIKLRMMSDSFQTASESIRTLNKDRIPSEEEQRAIDKCIQQLNNRAAPNTVLRAKRIILQFVCRDYCHIAPNELDELRTKDELYSTAAAWVRV
jgi:hypothetical protein